METPPSLRFPAFLQHILRKKRESTLSITCYGRKHGAGAQAQSIISTLLFASTTGIRYTHTPFQEITHNPEHLTSAEWCSHWENLFNLGDGEPLFVPSGREHVIPLDASFLRTAAENLDATPSREILLTARNCHFLADSITSQFEYIRPRLREKFGLGPRQKKDVLSVAVHARRGDVSAIAHSTRYTDDTELCKTVTALMAGLTAAGKPHQIRIFSEGRPSDFALLKNMGCEIDLETPAPDVFRQMAAADILVCAKSSFSYTAGILSQGLVFHEDFWHSPMKNWVSTDCLHSLPPGDFSRLLEPRPQSSKVVSFTGSRGRGVGLSFTLHSPRQGRGDLELALITRNLNDLAIFLNGSLLEFIPEKTDFFLNKTTCRFSVSAQNGSNELFIFCTRSISPEILTKAEFYFSEASEADAKIPPSVRTPETRKDIVSAPSKPTCLATVLTDKFVPGFIVFITSLIAKNPNFNLPVVLIHGTSQGRTLSKKSKLLARSYYANLHFHEVSEDSYAHLLAQGILHLNTPRRLHSAFFILEAFGLRDFQKVITFDCDMLCLGSIRDLLVASCDFGAVPAEITKEGPSQCFNSGLMVIGPALLASDIREKLLQLDLSSFSLPRDPLAGKADQAVLNHYFRSNGGYHALSDRFNFNKRRCPDDALAGDSSKMLELNEAVFLHYVAKKPWDLKVDKDETCYALVESLWHRQFWKVANSELALRLAHIQKTHLKDLQKNWEKKASSRPAYRALLGALKFFKGLGARTTPWHRGGIAA